MKEELSQEESRAILVRLRTKTPPERISPIFVKTRAATKIIDRATDTLKTISAPECNIPGFLVINATRGAGKTAIIQYLKEQYGDKVFFVYQEKSSTSAEDLFRFFVNRVGRQAITETLRSLSQEPLEIYKTLSEGGHTGTAIALAGLLEDNTDAWNWLCASSSVLPKLECGLKLVKNVRDNDALDALATVVRVLTRQKPAIFAIDELENAFNELSEHQKGKLRSLLVDLVNYTGFSKIFFLFAATDHVYEKCFQSQEADASGLTRKVKDATAVLSLPTREEARTILERILHLYERTYDISFSETESRHIEERFNAPSTMPSDVISYALNKGDEKWEYAKKYNEIAEKLEKESKKVMKNLSPIELGKKFEEAVGLLLRFLPGNEFQIQGAETIEEVKWLTERISGLKEVEKFLDWSVRIDSKDFWIEVCRTKKEDSVIPIGKTLAVFAKTLYHEDSAGLFITHNFNRFGIGKGAGKIIARFPELMKCVAILNLDEERFKILVGILGVEEEDRQFAAQFLFEKTGMGQLIEDLRGGKHFF